MKFKRWMIIPGLGLAVILVFFLSYGITFKNIEAMNAKNEMNRIIEKITVTQVEITKAEVGGTTSILYKINFRLPSKVTKKDIEKSVGFSLKFKNQPKEIYNIESTNIVKIFHEIENSKTVMCYVDFPLVPTSQKAEDIELLIKNKDSNIEFLLHNGDKLIKTIPLK